MRADLHLVLTQTNALRTRHGLSFLVVRPDLTALAAEQLLAEMKTGNLDHPDFKARFAQAEKDGYRTYGENALRQTINVDTAAAAVKGWETSPPHLANMLDRSFRFVGLAHVRGKGNGWWTQSFAG